MTDRQQPLDINRPTGHIQDDMWPAEADNVISLRPTPYSDKVLQHGRHPQNMGRMAAPDAHAVRVGWCGEVMEVYVRLHGDRVAEATFWADGCVSTMACGDMLTTLIRGLSLSDAMKITPEQLIVALDGLPFKSHHCAELSVETLWEAIGSRQQPLNDGRHDPAANESLQRDE